MLNRRTLLGLMAASTTAGAAETTGSLRIFRVRFRTVLVELEGRRVLIDPCFAPALGASVLFDAPPAAIAPEEVGDVDLVLVGAHEPGSFDATASRMRGRDAFCLVPDDRTASILRHHGYRRVRVVRAGDEVEARGVVVRVSPSKSFSGVAAVGFHLSREGRTLWHAGSPAPLDVDQRAADFARTHEAEMVVVAALGLSIGNSPTTLAHEDALLLAGLARARYLGFLDEGVVPTPLARVVMPARPGEGRGPPGLRTRIVDVEPGTWVRLGAGVGL